MNDPKVDAIAETLEAWLNEKPKWLQTAAAQMLEARRVPNDVEIAALVELCKAEAAGDKSATFTSVPAGSLSKPRAQSSIRLNALQDVCGVNVLQHKACLEFTDAGICVVYGLNGSGKTGFARVLKHMCGSRTREDILPDAFREDDAIPVARIRVEIDGTSQLIDWTFADGQIRQLKDVHVFDSGSAGMYVGANNEATYEPPSMRFLSLLVATCDRVALNVESQKEALVSRLPQIPPEFLDTAGSKWLGRLKQDTTTAEIDVECEFLTAADNERVAGEAALAERDVPGRLKQIATERAAIGRIKTQNETLSNELGDDSVRDVIALRLAAVEARRVATIDADRVFGSAPLNGVGSEAWQKLWQLAREFSEAHAYVGRPFPVVDNGARCVLCQQELGEDGAERFTHFEAFVRGGLEEAAKRAETAHATKVSALPDIPKVDDWVLQGNAIGLDEPVCRAIFESLRSRRLAIDTATRLEEVPACDWVTISASLQNKEQSLTTEEATLTALLKDDTRQKLQSRVVELRCRQWLSQNKGSIVDEATRLKALGLLESAALLTRTHAITRKKNELAESELSAGYQARFLSELSLLGGSRIPVVPARKLEGKGVVSFSLALRDAKRKFHARSVLSEGEARIVALAAFLADISGSGYPTPFIFDDPISSLDQTFEEHVAARLVELSKTRQVVIFTHRLSLLSLIESVVDRLEKQAKLEQVNPPVTLQVRAISRLGGAAGIVHDVNIRESRPKKAIHNLRDATLPRLAKLRSAAAVEEYSAQLLGACTDFRILLERCVEKVLLGDVIQRFRRSVETKGKIGILAKISTSDCLFIDDLMTRYSVFEHSQADELPSQLPDLDSFAGDVKATADWILEFEDRTVTE